MWRTVVDQPALQHLAITAPRDAMLFEERHQLALQAREMGVWEVVGEVDEGVVEGMRKLVLKEREG